MVHTATAMHDIEYISPYRLPPATRSPPRHRLFPVFVIDFDEGHAFHRWRA